LLEYKISYDPEADALYIRVKEDEISNTIELRENIIIDLNPKGELIGIEILNFTKTSINLNEILTEGIEELIPSIQR